MAENIERIIQLLERYDELLKSQSEINRRTLEAIVQIQERISATETRLQRLVETHNLWDGT
jgi:ribosomal protein S17E